MRRLLHVAMTRARKGLVLAWAESGPPGATPRPSPFYEEARAARRDRGGGLRGGAVRAGRGPPLDLPADARRAARHGRPGGRPPRRDAARHLPGRGPGGVALPRADQGGGADRAHEGRARRSTTALPELNEILAQCATAEQREILAQSALDSWLRDADRDPARRPVVGAERLRALARPVHPPPRARPDAVGLGHRHLPDLPAQVQVRARLPDPAGADDPPALRHRAAPGAGALPLRRAAATSRR